jgi:hypothetical protein
MSWPVIVSRLCLNVIKMTNIGTKDYLMNVKNLRYNLDTITGQDVIQSTFL